MGRVTLPQTARGGKGNWLVRDATSNHIPCPIAITYNEAVARTCGWENATWVRPENSQEC